jgi:hypothetical protein
VGGYGSGGHNRRRGYLEGYRRICVSYLRRHDLMRPGVYSTLSWTNSRGEATGSMQVIGAKDFVTLIYSVRGSDQEAWRQVEERVALAHISKPFGGQQAYLTCPSCARRVMELILGKERFRCRMCLGLVHTSSQESSTNRAMRKANKLKNKLGAEPGLDSFYRRPRHMRRLSFARISARIQAAEAEVNDAHIRLLTRLGRLDARHRASAGRGRTAKRAFW